LNFPSAFLIWAVLLLLAIFAGILRGYGGRVFGIVMAVFAVLLAGLIFSAAADFRERWQKRVGERGIILAPLLPLAAFAAYGINVGLAPARIFVGCAYVLIPSLLVLGARGKSGVNWADFAAVVIVWLPVEFRWMYQLVPFPRELTHTLTILFALNTALAAFVYVRRLEGVGYSVEWSSGIALQVAIHFALLAAILIPLGEKINFIHFGPSAANFKPAPLLVAVLGISFFTAWPEEFLFRGLLQNLLGKLARNEWVGLVIAAVIFGFSHILHAPFPNWRYVLLATIAGLLYGHVWMRTRTIFASAIVHALVDILWHLLFR
jgi:uncharacterized protein